MEIDKAQVVAFLEKEGKSEHAQKALHELPEKIDHEKHAQMLEKLGVDPGKLVEQQLSGRLGL